MKVALLCNAFPPELRGGTEQVVGALGRALQAAGERVIVLATSARQFEGEAVIEETVEGLQVLRMPRTTAEQRGDLVHRRRLVDLVSELCAREDVDVLHVHGMEGPGLGHVPAAVAAGRGVVVTLHDLWTACPRGFRTPIPGVTCPDDTDRAPCVRCLQADVPLEEGELRAALEDRDAAVAEELDSAHRITAPSTFAARAVEKLTRIHGEVQTLPHGLLAPVADERVPRAEEGPLRIGTFGNLVAVKGVLDLVRAARGLPVELHLSGRYLPEVFGREVHRAAQSAGVTLRDHGPYGPGVPHPARALDLAVFPSHCDESYGLVVDEALARGVPCLVSDRGALPERGCRGGVEVASFGDLDRVLRHLVTDPDALAGLARAAAVASPPPFPEAVARYRILLAEALAAARNRPS